MAKKIVLLAAVQTMAFLLGGCREGAQDREGRRRLNIVASDTLLSGMIASLLPSESAAVAAILPPGQCPGHYDMKLTDVERAKKADLVVSLRGLPFMTKADIAAEKLLLLDARGRNWMSPDSYVVGLRLLAAELSIRFPQNKPQIIAGMEKGIKETTDRAKALAARIKQAGFLGMPVLASSMQKQSLEWMGFRVVADYGRPEALSAKEIARLTQIGIEKKAVMVVDNLQSGPEAGKGIADALGAPHVILSNFPSEKGYAGTLDENVTAVLEAAGKI